MRKADQGVGPLATFRTLNEVSTNIIAISEIAASANSNSSDPLAGDGILIAKFWKSARNRREHVQLALKSFEGNRYLDIRVFTVNAEADRCRLNRALPWA